MRHPGTQPPEDLPAAWRDELARYGWVRQTIGKSTASVFRLELAGCPTLFVKCEPAGRFGEVPDEAARLRWLAAQGIACPALRGATRENGRDWLLTEAVPGRDLASSPDLAPERIVDIAADALRDLHRLDAACPFDHRLANRIPAARARMEAGLVDESDFDDERLGRTARDLFVEVMTHRPAEEDVVVTHGDACLPNMLAAAGRFTGFVDCARLGIADRHQDVALAARSIGGNLGEDWVAPFLRRYGGTIDPQRLAFYRLLDEFF